MRFVARADRDEEGQVIVLVAILALALVFMVALVVNVGMLFMERRALQNAADQAALAGAYSQWLASDGVGTPIQDACKAAALNGVATSGTPTPGGTCPLISNGPTVSVVVPDNTHVEVTITQPVRAWLVPEWGPSTVRAFARAGTSGVGSTDGVFAVGQGGLNRSLRVASNGTLTMCAYTSPRPTSAPVPLQCPPGSTAAGATPGPGAVARVASDAGPCPNGAVYNQNTSTVAPNVGPSDAGVVSPGAICGQWPNPTTGPPVGDPYVQMPQPVPGPTATPGPGGSGATWCGSALCAYYTRSDPPPSASLQPGLYQGVTISGNVNYVLAPGIYVFAGRTSSGQSSGVNIGGSGTLTVDPSCSGANCGVLLFFTYNNWPDVTTPSGSCATFSVNTGAVMQLAPRTSGTWKGWLIWYDAGPGGYCAGANLTLGGNSDLNLQRANGLVYAPAGILNFDGNGTSAQLSQLVTSEITVQNGDLYIDLGTALNLPKPPPRLMQ